LVGATTTLLPNGLNETAGGWLTGGTAPSQLLGQSSDPALMAAFYQQQAMQQVCGFACLSLPAKGAITLK